MLIQLQGREVEKEGDRAGDLGFPLVPGSVFGEVRPFPVEIYVSRCETVEAEGRTGGTN